MAATGHLLQLLILLFSGWLQRQQAEVIEYLKAENRMLRQKLGAAAFYSPTPSVIARA